MDTEGYSVQQIGDILYESNMAVRSAILKTVPRAQIRNDFNGYAELMLRKARIVERRETRFRNPRPNWGPIGVDGDPRDRAKHHGIVNEQIINYVDYVPGLRHAVIQEMADKQIDIKALQQGLLHNTYATQLEIYAKETLPKIMAWSEDSTLRLPSGG